MSALPLNGVVVLEFSQYLSGPSAALRLADLGAKHAFLKAGFGWGHMPKHMVEKDIADGLLVSLTLQNMPAAAMYLTTKIVYRKDAPPGPAGRAFISQLKI